MNKNKKFNLRINILNNIETFKLYVYYIAGSNPVSRSSMSLAFSMGHF